MPTQSKEKVNLSQAFLFGESGQMEAKNLLIFLSFQEFLLSFPEITLSFEKKNI